MDNTQLSMSANHPTGPVLFLMSGNSSFYAQHLRTEIQTVTLTMPSSVPKYFYVYDAAGTAMGKVPLIP